MPFFSSDTLPIPPFCSRSRCRLANRSRLAKRYEPPIPSFSLSARSNLAKSFRSRSILPKLAEYLGNVGGGIGRAAIAGFSLLGGKWALFTLWMPAVNVVVPGEERIGLVGGIGGGPMDFDVGGGARSVAVVVFEDDNEMDADVMDCELFGPPPMMPLFVFELLELFSVPPPPPVLMLLEAVVVLLLSLAPVLPPFDAGVVFADAVVLILT